MASSSITLPPGEQVTATFEDTLGALLHRSFAVLKYGSVPAAKAVQPASDGQALPTEFALGQNEPNPFGDGTLIRFAVPARSQVAIEVFDIHGRRIRTITRTVAAWLPLCELERARRQQPTPQARDLYVPDGCRLVSLEPEDGSLTMMPTTNHAELRCTPHKHPGVLQALFIIATVLVLGPEAQAQAIGSVQNVSGNTDEEIENAPAVDAMGENMVAAWFRNVFGSNVRVATSADAGATWADSTLVTESEFEQLFGRVSTCIDGTGSAFLACYGARSRTGMSVFIYRTQSFVTPLWQRLPNAIPYVSLDERPIDGVQLMCDRQNNILYLAYTRRPGLRESFVSIVRSTDFGASWSTPLALSGTLCNTAQIALGPDGELYVAWEDYARMEIVGRKSVDSGVTFGAEFAAGPIRDNLGWSPPSWRSTPGRAAIMPNATCMDAPGFIGLAADRSIGPNRGNVYAVWTDYATGSIDPNPMRIVAEVEPNNEFANATLIAIGDNVTGAMASADEPPFAGDCDKFVFEGTAGTTIQVTGGARICFPSGSCQELAKGYDLVGGGEVTSLHEIGCSTVYGPGTTPPMIYTLPTTGRYYLDLGCAASGSISYTLSLREYHIPAGQVARDHRDVVIVRSTNGGVTWSSKTRVNDDLPQYDNAIPAVAVDDAGRVHVAWYDRRDESDYSGRVHTYWTWSEDGALTFAPSRRVSEQPSDAAGEGARWLVGDHLALEADGGSVHLLWTHVPIGGGGEIYGATITDVPTSINAPRLQVARAADKVTLRWYVSDDREVRGFRLHRALGQGSYQIAAEIAVIGNRQYQWIDTNVSSGTTYRYRLEVIHEDGQSAWDEPVEVTIAAAPGQPRWRGATPNPFSERVDLALDAPQGALIQVEVFDVLGHQVGTVRPRRAGDQWLVSWDGKDGRGRNVAPGVYLVQAEVGGARVTQRLVRMR